MQFREVANSVHLSDAHANGGVGAGSRLVRAGLAEFAKKLAEARKGQDCQVKCEGCGCKGGPGYRSLRTMQCVGYKNLVAECGPPPHELASANAPPSSPAANGRLDLNLQPSDTLQ